MHGRRAAPVANGPRTALCVRSRHEAIEESRKLLMAIERKNVRDILVRPRDHHATRFAINATHAEDVVAAFEIGAEHFFVVAKSVTSLPG